MAEVPKNKDIPRRNVFCTNLIQTTNMYVYMYIKNIYTNTHMYI